MRICPILTFCCNGVYYTILHPRVTDYGPALFALAPIEARKRSVQGVVRPELKFELLELSFDVVVALADVI